MLGIRIRGLYKTFGKTVAVNNLSLDIAEGEFLSLLGPSGCGKTTVLRCLAGLETPDAGEIYIGDKLIFSSDKGISVPPGKRGIGMVFQSYALWPHLSVHGNISFGLELTDLSRDQLNNRISEVLRLVGIEELAHRYPAELSGGQQQRVALARAIVTQPAILLLDEPLSNLDAKLRLQMRAELQRLHRSLKCVVVYVTHDQLEAMTLSSKIALMKGGILQQHDSPHHVYDFPNNSWVADFVGNPSINRLSGTVMKDVRNIRLKNGHTVSLKWTFLKEGEKVHLGLRPEEIHIGVPEQSKDSVLLTGILHSIQPAGGETFVQVRVGEDVLTIRISGKIALDIDQEVNLWIDQDKILIFGEDDGRLKRRPVKPGSTA